MQVGSELAQLRGDDTKTRASRNGQVTYSVDSQGDVHACFGMQCPHVRLNHENQYVCGISGRVVGVEHACDPDPVLDGPLERSANPDDTAGTPVGGWVKRRDMYAASVAAYRRANQISDAEIAPVLRQPGVRSGLKRGALCVDEARRAAGAQEAAQLAQGELVARGDRQARQRGHRGHRQAVHRHAQSAARRAAPDPRLQNLEFVKAMAIRKYVGGASTARASSTSTCSAT